ncbi:MAG: FtsH protease activity modulator HflK [Burkholderiales bacterium]|nr:FtsH protease activity modulator HflK [Burkholderiales bacterium]
MTQKLLAPPRLWFKRLTNFFLWQIHAWVSYPVLAQENDPSKDGVKPTGDADSNSATGSSKPTNSSNSKDGPPDLDVLWNDFNRRLGSMFGGKGKTPSQNGDRTTNSDSNPAGSNEPPPREPPKFPSGGQTSKPAKNFGEMAQDWMKKNMNNSGGSGNSGGSSGNKDLFQLPKIGLGLVLLVVVVVWTLSGIFIVQEGQAGVVLQFGKYKYTTRPGINWRLPSPIQAHEIVNVSNVRSVEIGRSFVIQATNLRDSSMLTEDENIIDVKFSVQYRLKEPTDYIFKNRDPDGAVVQAAETSIREIVGKSKMDDVLYVGRERIGIELAAAIQGILDSYKSGVFITSVNVQNVQPPEQVQASFDDAVKAGQDQERQKNEGQAYANDIIPRAKGAAGRLLEEAQGYRSKVIATAEGDASRFKQIYVEYAKAQQVTRDRMYIDVMQQIYSNVTKVMVDSKAGNQLLYLPLDKLIQQTTGPQDASVGSGANYTAPSANSAVQPPSGSVTVPLNPSSNPNSQPSDKRETFRSRERDIR